MSTGKAIAIFGVTMVAMFALVVTILAVAITHHSTPTPAVPVLIVTSCVPGKCEILI